MLQSLRAPPLHDAIQRQLKQYILDRGLRPGDRLPTEEQVSREIGVSRNVVREALRSLESIGMIEARHGEGRFVRQFTFDAILDNLAYAVFFDRHSFDELLEVRGELETAFIGRAAQVLDATDLRGLWQAVEGMRRKATSGHPYLPEDETFHSLIFRKLGNQLLSRLLDIFWRVSVALHSSGDLPLPGGPTLDEVCGNHARIAMALERRDGDQARTAMKYHFDYARAELAKRDSPVEAAVPESASEAIEDNDRETRSRPGLTLSE